MVPAAIVGAVRASAAAAAAAAAAVPAAARPRGEFADDAAEAGVQGRPLGPPVVVVPGPAVVEPGPAIVVEPGPVGPVAPAGARVRRPRRSGPRGEITRDPAEPEVQPVGGRDGPGDEDQTLFVHARR